MLTPVAVYRRSVNASLERVWENVRDWEHLPWLHSESFRSIECEDEGAWGWRARIGLRPESGGEIRLELVRGGEDRYVARTLEGPGRGTEIWTRLAPATASRTDVEVEFRVPDVSPEQVGAVGAVFVKLYTRLWDEDEAMMVRRTRELAAARASGGAPRELRLGSLDEVRARLPLAVELGGRSFRVVEIDGGLFAHATTCPHRLGPLGDCAVEHGRIRCPWHGYAFDVATGRSADGRRLRLAPAPRVAVDDAGDSVRLVPR